MANSHLHSRHFGFRDFKQTENTTAFLVFATLPCIKMNTWNETERYRTHAGYTVDILTGSTGPALTLLSGIPFLSSHFLISRFSVLKFGTLLTTLL